MKFSCVKCLYKYIFMGNPQIQFNMNILQDILHAKKCKLSPIISPRNMHIHNSLSYVAINMLYINIHHTGHYELEVIFMCARLPLIAMCNKQHRSVCIKLFLQQNKKAYVTRFEKSSLPRTQQQDTLFTIKRQLYMLTNNSARY